MNNTHYKSEKLTFCAWLIAVGKATLVGTEPTGYGKQMFFILSKCPTEKEVSEFYSGEGIVSALEYSEVMARLKSIVYERRKALQI